MAGRHEIWLIRHGETEWSASGRHTGRTDVPLTPAGRRQAEALGHYLAGRPFALVLTSPLARARETCRLAGYESIARTSEDLREWDYGIYEGRTTADIRVTEPGWSIWIADCYICPSCPIGRPLVRRFDARPFRPLILVATQGFRLESQGGAIALPPHAIVSLSVRKRRKEGV